MKNYIDIDGLLIRKDKIISVDQIKCYDRIYLKCNIMFQDYAEEHKTNTYYYAFNVRLEENEYKIIKRMTKAPLTKIRNNIIKQLN